VYAALLVLAAVPPEVRPRAIEKPGEIARTALRFVGIRPGVAVFEASRAASQRIVRNDCIRVRGVDARGRAQVVAPPLDACVTHGVQLLVPWTEGMLRSLVLRAPPGVAEAAIGDWVCHAPRFASQGFRQVQLAWTAPWIDRSSGAEGVTSNARIVWRCDPPGLEQRVLGTGDAPAGGSSMLPAGGSSMLPAGG